MSKKNKTTYKVDNWPEYNKSLCQRGRLDIWIDEQVLDRWLYEGPTQQGAQYTYSGFAIETCLSLRLIFGLGLRQTQGLVCSLLRLIGSELPVPDYSVLSRRGEGRL